MTVYGSRDKNSFNVPKEYEINGVKTQSNNGNARYYLLVDSVTGDTTITYNGQINYGDKGKIKIDWYDGSEYEFEVSKDGGITKCNSSLGTIDKNNFELTFTDDLCSPRPLGANYTIS